MPRASFSTRTAAHRHQPTEVERLLDRVEAGAHAVRVVGRVHQDRRRRAHRFEPARRAHGREGSAHGVDLDGSGCCAGPEERLDGGQRDGRVLCLVGAVQRQEDLVVTTAETLQAHQLSPNSDLAVDHTELGTLARDHRARVDSRAQKRSRSLGRLRSQNHVGVRFDDAGLLGGDLGHGVAEEFHMVKPDRRDHGNLGCDLVRRVPPPAEPDLDHSYVDGRIGERGVRQRGHHLEEGELDLEALVHQCDVWLDLPVNLDEALGRDRCAVDHHSLGDAREVRTRVSPTAQAEAQQQGVDHAGRRGLAVRPGQMNRAVGALRFAEQIE